MSILVTMIFTMQTLQKLVINAIHNIEIVQKRKKNYSKIVKLNLSTVIDQ